MPAPPLPPEPHRPFPWLLSMVIMVGTVGPAWFLYKNIVPSEEKTYRSMAPDLQENVRRNQMLLTRMQEEREALERQRKDGTPIREVVDPETAKPNWV